MYSIKPFFVEIFPERVDGWTAEARFSRQGDYAKPIKVPKVRFFLRAVKPTKGYAEQAAEFATCRRCRGVQVVKPTVILWFLALAGIARGRFAR
ncbi:hypothetical protein, partial [Paraburkholderia sp. EG304]|uniref:hypothetical protein n=1 Tax=Paraburkholderia sp. EG304 TaxID=3237015 RepID=UPI00397A181A